MFAKTAPIAMHVSRSEKPNVLETNSAKIMNASEPVQKYLGWALLPQAGVAIGLTVVAQTVVPQYAETVRAVVLCGTLIYELIGPSVSKWALTQAGEIVE